MFSYGRGTPVRKSLALRSLDRVSLAPARSVGPDQPFLVSFLVVVGDVLGGIAELEGVALQACDFFSNEFQPSPPHRCRTMREHSEIFIDNLLVRIHYHREDEVTQPRALGA